jgi:hypothetical protein
MGKKADYVCRLAFLNVDTFPVLASDPNNGTARATFKKWQIDVWGWAEINVNWLLVKQSYKLEYICKEWFKNTAVITEKNKTIKDHQISYETQEAAMRGGSLSGKRQVST